jgi:CRP-like cAMP-binding protein
MLLQALFTVVMALSIKLIIDAVVDEPSDASVGLIVLAPRNATVTAVTSTTTLSLDRDQFQSVIAGDPEMANAVREAALDRARQNGAA